MAEIGWIPPQTNDVSDVDVLMQMIANEEVAVHGSYNPYTPPHSDDASSPPAATASFNGSFPNGLYNSDTRQQMMNQTPEYEGIWHSNTRKRRRHSATSNEYATTVLSMENAAFQAMEQLDPSEIEAELQNLPTLRTDCIKEETTSPPPCRSSCQNERNDESGQLSWNPYDLEHSCCLCNERSQPLPPPKLHISADKGFSYSTIDEAFVNHRKNHFQISMNAQFQGQPSHILLSGGTIPLTNFHVDIHGIKVDSLNQKVLVEQSQADRRKSPYRPICTRIAEDGSITTTISRLHFSETTQNNHRKRGMPNPEQKFFKLVVIVYAVSNNQAIPYLGSVSDRFIVRASNPKQFESENSDPQWQPGITPASMYYKGRVGINTSSPEESLAVQGNIKVSGQILQPSDARVKDKISEVNYNEQLKNMSVIRLHQYRYKEAYSSTVDIPPQQQTEIGVIAQEIRDLMPDAVMDVGDIELNNGEKIENLLVVNKDRIFLESVGAVKELCKLTGNMESRLCDLEQRDRKLTRIIRKLGGSMSSNSSSCSKSSRSSKASEASTKPEPSPISNGGQSRCYPMYRMKQEIEKRSRRMIICLMALVFFLSLISVSAITAAVLYSERSKGATVQPKSVDSGTLEYVLDDSIPVVRTTFKPIKNVLVHDELPPMTVVEAYLNCTMTACRQEGCCGKDVSPTVEAQTSASVKAETSSMANKYREKSDKAQPQSESAATDTSSQAVAAHPLVPKDKSIPDTGMMADGAIVFKNELKMRRKRNAGIHLDLETECTVSMLTRKSLVYLCPASGMANTHTIVVRIRSQCKLADITCSCECRPSTTIEQSQADCWSSALRITVTGDNCQP